MEPESATSTKTRPLSPHNASKRVAPVLESLIQQRTWRPAASSLQRSKWRRHGHREPGLERLQSDALVLASDARKPQPNRLPSLIVGLEVLVSEAVGFEFDLLHLDALGQEELAQILLPLLGPLLRQRSILLCVLSPPLWKRALLRPHSHFENPSKSKTFECNNKILCATTRYCIATARYCMQQQGIACVRLIRQDRREVHAMACDLVHLSLLRWLPQSSGIVGAHEGAILCAQMTGHVLVPPLTQTLAIDAVHASCGLTRMTQALLEDFARELPLEILVDMWPPSELSHRRPVAQKRTRALEGQRQLVRQRPP